MSYDISLKDKDGGQVVSVDNHEEGGTYCLGGTTEASLNVTYNYSPFYYHFLDQDHGIRWLYGKTGKQSIPRLEYAIEKLKPLGGDYRFENYWAPTPSNASHALQILLSWAKQHPTATFSGD